MSIASPARSQPGAATLCRQCLSSLRRHQTRPSNHNRTSRRPASTLTKPLANVSGQKSDDNAQSVPRWAATPSAMRAPYRLKPRNDNDEFPCNDDPAKLDAMYEKFLGKDAVDWLESEVKWLAITHKSFDQGRRGYNERLAFLGRKMMELQTGLALMNKGPGSGKQLDQLKRKDIYGRYPFMDPALDGISNVSIFQKEQVLDEKRLAQLAERSGLQEVIRWKPRQVRDLKASGVDSVLATAVYAILGSVALQKGGAVATETMRRKVLTPLGVL